VVKERMDQSMEHNVQNGNLSQMVFARWRSGYFYPAVIISEFENIARVNYLDGHHGAVPREHIISIEEGLDTLDLQGDWRGWGYYKGRLNKETMTMYYNDGDVEHVEISQLRGKLPGESGFANALARVVVAGVSVVVVVGTIIKAVKVALKGNQRTYIETSKEPLIIDHEERVD